MREAQHRHCILFGCLGVQRGCSRIWLRHQQLAPVACLNGGRQLSQADAREDSNELIDLQSVVRGEGVSTRPFEPAAWLDGRPLGIPWLGLAHPLVRHGDQAVQALLQLHQRRTEVHSYGVLIRPAAAAG